MSNTLEQLSASFRASVLVRIRFIHPQRATICVSSGLYILAHIFDVEFSKPITI